MSFTWTRDLSGKLINLYEQHDLLHNPRHPDNRDPKCRAEAYQAVVVEMQKVEPKITLDHIKRKWKNIRSSYADERRNIQNALRNGYGKTTPTLWCYEQLNYLQYYLNAERFPETTDDILEERKQGDPLLKEPDESIDESVLEVILTPPPNEDSNSSYEEPQAKRLKQDIPSDHEIQCKDELSDVEFEMIQKELADLRKIVTQREGTGRHYEWVGEVVVSHINDMHPDDQAFAAWQVQCFMRKLLEKSALKH